MPEPRYEFWRDIKPIEGQPIPPGAEFEDNDGKSWSKSVFSEFIWMHTQWKWRAPVEVVPIDIAVEAILELHLESIPPDAVELTRKSIATYLRSEAAAKELREQDAVDQNPDHTQSFTTDHNESENLGNRGFLHDSQGIRIPPVPPVGLEPIAANGDCDSACRDGLSAGDHKTDQIGEQSC